jgi:hypothetical protein
MTLQSIVQLRIVSALTTKPPLLDFIYSNFQALSFYALRVGELLKRPFQKWPAQRVFKPFGHATLYA